MYKYHVGIVIQKTHENTRGKCRYKKMLNCTFQNSTTSNPKTTAEPLGKASTPAQKGVSSSRFGYAHTSSR